MAMWDRFQTKPTFCRRNLLLKLVHYLCLLYTSDAADERSSVDLGGRRIIKKKKNIKFKSMLNIYSTNINIKSKTGTVRKKKNKRKTQKN